MTHPTSGVTLIIPGRNAESTLPACLDAATELLGLDGLEKIVFVDDGSTDRTAEIAATYPVEVVRLGGAGPGGARNAGLERVQTELVWFIDSDCVPDADALRHLLSHAAAGDVAGVGGSYDNAEPDSLLACMIHEEIRERHLRMGADVDFLGSFNVLYRSRLLEAGGGFDETRFNSPGAPGAEDAELAFRLKAGGHQLRFEPESRVAHYHPTRLRSYLRAQRLHGYWATRLYLSHPARAIANSYSSVLDHVQPIVGLALLVSLATLPIPSLRFLPVALLAGVLLLPLPMTVRLLRRTSDPRMLMYAPLSAVRAVTRGVGMFSALLTLPFRPLDSERRTGTPSATTNGPPMRSV